MSAPKVKATINGEIIAIRFPLLDGMREWATDELRAEFITDEKKWRYELPYSRANLELVVRSCPLGIEVVNETGEAVRKVDAANDLESSAPAYRTDLPQPTIRVHDAWPHQLAAYSYVVAHRGVAMLNMGMGTGKSKVTIDYAVNDGVRLMLVVCPPRVLGVWRREFRYHAPEARVAILDESFDSVAKKLKAAQAMALAARMQGNQRTFAICINYESFRMAAFANWAANQIWDLVVCDESHRAKDPSGATAKAVHRLRLRARRRLCLTGTPMAHSPADLWSQYAFIDPAVFGSSYFAFKKRYAITGFFKEIVGWRHKDELRERFHSRCITIGEEVLSLPPMHQVEREFSLDKSSLRLYKELWLEFCAEVAGGVVAFDNALVKLIRAQQITSGFLPVEDPETGVEKLEIINDAKVRELEDILVDLGPRRRVVVFCRWTYDLAAVRSLVERMEWELNGVAVGNEKRKTELQANGGWQNYRCGEISGKRSDMTPDAKLSPDFEVFAVQVQSGGVGVDFTDASVAVLYSIDFSLGNYEQMLKRLHRPGQKSDVLIIRMVARGTVDRQIYTALKERRDVVQSIVDAARSGAALSEEASA